MLRMEVTEPWYHDSDTLFDEIERKKKVKEAKGKRKAAETFMKLKLKRKKK